MMNGAPEARPGPPALRVPSGGASGPVAAFLAVAALAAVVGVSLLGQRDDRPSGSDAALAEPTMTTGSARTPSPTARTPAATPARTPTPVAQASPTPPDGDGPPPFSAGALPGDDGSGPLPPGTVDALPNPDRLDFLFLPCTECMLDAHWMDPADPRLGSGVWTAGRPFHVREGFINDREEPLGPGFGVVLYVTRVGEGRDHATYRYTSDYVLRGTTDRCGPTFRTQAGPVTCEWFVHDFPEGLPEGRYAITAVWEAPCRAWVDLGLTDVCEDPDEVISRFWSGVNAPYQTEGPSYTERSS